MTSTKIKIGIIGAGRLGITHYSIMNSYPDVVIESVADPSSMVPAMMNKYSPISTCKDFKLLFEKLSPDMHFLIIQIAGARGIHVFMEKVIPSL